MSTMWPAMSANPYPMTIPARWPMKLACGTMMLQKMSEPNGARLMGRLM